MHMQTEQTHQDPKTVRDLREGKAKRCCQIGPDFPPNQRAAARVARLGGKSTSHPPQYVNVIPSLEAAFI